MSRAAAAACCLTGLLLCLLALPALAQPPTVPNLVGTWEATAFAMHDKQHGFVEADGKAATLVVKEQHGRLFHGVVEWAGKAPGKDTFSGVIDKDNDNFYFVGHDEGLRLGKLDGPDAFTFYFLTPGGPNPRAGYVTYRRVKS